MVEIAVVLLELPDGRLVFQRRGPEAPTSPGLLGLFGGHLEKGEQPLEAVCRELGEETSLELTTSDFTRLNEVELKNPDGSARKFFYFQASVPNSNFAVFEGEAAETYSLTEALKRDDLTKSTQFILGSLDGS